MGVIGGKSFPFWVDQFYKHKRLARLFNHKEGFPAVKVTNLKDSKILMGVRDRPPGEPKTAVLTGNPRIQDVCEDTQQCLMNR